MTSIRRFALIFLLTACWSPSFLFIKWAIVDLPPITIDLLRVVTASLIITTILLVKRQKLPTSLTFWVDAGITSLLSAIIPLCLFCYAEKTIESSWAALLNGLTPVFTAVLAHFFVPSDKLSFQKSTGIAVAFAGLLLLFLPGLHAGGEKTQALLLGTLAALSYAISHVYAKNRQSGYPMYVVPAAQLLFATITLIPLSLLLDHPLELPPPSLLAWTGIAGLSLIGTVFGLILYYKLLDECGPTALSMVVCLFPVMGMVMGILFLDESTTTLGLAASFLIFLGLWVVTTPEKPTPIIITINEDRKTNENI